MPTLNTPRVREGMETTTGLWKYYTIDRGVTLLVDGVTVTETRYPSIEDFDNYDHVYVGGHVYDISTDEATVLTNAGYGAYIT